MITAQVGYTMCSCCKLPQLPGVDKVTGVTARVCNECTNHQGDQDRKRVQRAESHERMLRLRMDRCRTSEANATAEKRAAQAEAKEARRATAAALASRGRLAARIVDAAADGTTALAALARDSAVTKWARQAEAAQAAADMDEGLEFRDLMRYW